jgi:hypothetical protein
MPTAGQFNIGGPLAFAATAKQSIDNCTYNMQD